MGKKTVEYICFILWSLGAWALGNFLAEIIINELTGEKHILDQEAQKSFTGAIVYKEASLLHCEELYPSSTHDNIFRRRCAF